MNKNKLIIIGYSGYLCIKTTINNGTTVLGYCTQKTPNKSYNLRCLAKEEQIKIDY